MKGKFAFWSIFLHIFLTLHSSDGGNISNSSSTFRYLKWLQAVVVRKPHKRQLKAQTYIGKGMYTSIHLYGCMFIYKRRVYPKCFWVLHLYLIQKCISIESIRSISLCNSYLKLVRTLQTGNADLYIPYFTSLSTVIHSFW